MFSGIVEEAARIESIRPSDRSIELVVNAQRVSKSVRVGDSIAVNGCCLTLVKLARVKAESRLHFDLLRETWEKTSFPHLAVGGAVNLERSLRMNSRIGGHFVTGHVDGTGSIVRWERSGQDWVLDVNPPRDLMRYFVSKGSLAIDGISLTLAEVHEDAIRVWIIPHTREVTNLRERQVGELVNLEADLLGKYVERLIEARAASIAGSRSSSNKARSPGRASR